MMNVLRFLNQNVKPAFGCTDPITVGYATALAYYAIYNCLPPDFNCRCPKAQIESVIRISISQDRDSYKNGLAIAIPGTNGKKGTALAAALGIFLNPSKGLSIFEDICPDIIKSSKKLIDDKKIIFKKNKDASEIASIDVVVTLEYAIEGVITKSKARIQNKPDGISEISVNEKILYERSPQSEIGDEENIPDSIEEMINVVTNINENEKKYIYEGLVMNKVAALEGLKGDYGIYLGKKIKQLINEGILSDNLITRIKMMAAAAGDARMGGASLPIMSTAGSGNQGITGLIPIVVVGEEKNIDKEKMIQSALLVHLVTKFMLNKSQYLSALCGCAIKAGIGAAAGLSYMLGGNIHQIGNAVNIMAANLTGMICDGAKAGCALKLSTAAATAAESAFLAILGTEVPTDNGILFDKPEDTIQNIGDLSREMVSTDVKIVDIMQSKQKTC
jgi:L-cysteine desulfidase